MGKTVERTLKFVALDTETAVSTVDEDEDHKLTVTIALLAVLLICLLPFSRVPVIGSGISSSVVVVVSSCCVAGVSSYVETFSWAFGLVVGSICSSVITSSTDEWVWTSLNQTNKTVLYIHFHYEE